MPRKETYTVQELVELCQPFVSESGVKKWCQRKGATEGYAEKVGRVWIIRSNAPQVKKWLEQAGTVRRLEKELVQARKRIAYLESELARRA